MSAPSSQEASRQVKAAITARFGKGWSVRLDRGPLFIQGPVGAEGRDRRVPAGPRAVLAEIVGYDVPLSGLYVWPHESPGFIWKLENGPLHDAHVRAWADWNKAEKDRQFRAARPWVLLTWSPYDGGYWQEHSCHLTKERATEAAAKLQAHGIESQIDFKEQP